jgi:pimeloyl-ACP methyl ester carboxylesterase
MSDYLLVHGGFNGGWVWEEVAGRLQGKGHGVRVVAQLPSAGTDPQSLGDLAADANIVRRMLDVVEEPVVLVGHSYGGMVITEVADHPKVRHSVYLTALWPKRGQSVLDQFGGALPNVISRRDDGVLEFIDDFELAWKSMCSDVDRDRAEEVLSHFVLQSGASFVAPSVAPVRTHPTTYVIATQEADFSVAAQEARAVNADFVVRLPAAHMVQLSCPDGLTEAFGQI